MILHASRQELSDIMFIYKTCVKDMNERGLFNWDETYPSVNDVLDDIDKGTLFIYKPDQGPIATVCLDETEPREYKTVNWRSSKPALFVHRLAVLPEWQNKKIGQTIMGFAKKHAIENTYKSIRLDVLEKNPQAMQLYRKCGYNEVGTIHFSYLNDPFRCMELNLKD